MDSKIDKQSQPEKLPLKSMKPLPYFNSESLPPEDIVNFVIQMNAHIVAYNAATQLEEKRTILGTMQAILRDMDHHFTFLTLAGSPTYLYYHDTLLQDIQYQQTFLSYPEVPLSLAEFIATLSPVKANELLTLLLRSGTKSRDKVLRDLLEELYDASDVSPEAEAYRAFLQDHSFSYLGGGNSRNFLCTQISTGDSLVLKVANNRYTGRLGEDMLRSKNPSLLAPVYADRLVSCDGVLIGKTDIQVMALLVTDYYPKGNIYECISKQSVLDPEARPMLVIHYGQQMAAAFQEIQEIGCIFPDAKIQNWAADDAGRAHIIDPKSLIPQSDYTTEHIWTSKDCRPPEYSSPKAVPEAMHAFMLGKNLYAVLTNRWGDGADGVSFDFTAEVFTTPAGIILRRLITLLVQPVAKDRMSIQEALTELHMLNTTHLCNKYSQIINTLDKHLRVTEDDDDVIEQYEQAFLIELFSTPLAEREALFDRVDQVLAPLSLMSQAYKDFEAFIETSAANDVGMQQFLQSFRNRLLVTPVEQRAGLLTSFLDNLLPTQLQEISRRSEQVFSKLTSLRVGAAEDKYMVDYIEKKKNALNLASPEQKLIMLSELEAEAAILEANVAINTINTIMRDFGWHATTLSLDMLAKAYDIETAMRELNIPERLSYTSLPAGKTKKVKTALEKSGFFSDSAKTPTEKPLGKDSGAGVGKGSKT